MGAGSGVSKSEVSRICADLDEDVAAFNGRDLSDQAFPYVFLDATYCKARVGGGKGGKGAKVCSQAVIIATGVAADGRREVLGCVVGDSEAEVFWAEFLRSLRERGLAGVQLVISDHHSGLRKAIDAVFLGSSWQRCRVHFMRNALAKVPKGSQEMVAAAIRTIFSQPTAPMIRDQVDTIAATLEAQFPDRGNDVARLQGADHRVRRLPGVTLAENHVHEPHRAAQPRGEAPDRRGRDLPEPGRAAAAGDLRAHRGPRRMAGRRPPLPVGGVHGPAQPARTHRNRARDTPTAIRPFPSNSLHNSRNRVERNGFHHSRGRDPVRRPSQDHLF